MSHWTTKQAAFQQNIQFISSNEQGPRMLLSVLQKFDLGKRPHSPALRQTAPLSRALQVLLSQRGLALSSGTHQTTGIQHQNMRPYAARVLRGCQSAGLSSFPGVGGVPRDLFVETAGEPPRRSKSRPASRCRRQHSVISNGCSGGDGIYTPYITRTSRKDRSRRLNCKQVI